MAKKHAVEVENEVIVDQAVSEVETEMQEQSVSDEAQEENEMVADLVHEISEMNVPVKMRKPRPHMRMRLYWIDTADKEEILKSITIEKLAKYADNIVDEKIPNTGNQDDMFYTAKNGLWPSGVSITAEKGGVRSRNIQISLLDEQGRTHSGEYELIFKHFVPHL